MCWEDSGEGEEENSISALLLEVVKLATRRLCVCEEKRTNFLSSLGRRGNKMSIKELSLTHLQYPTHTRTPSPPPLTHTTHTPSTQPHPPPYNVTELTVKTALFTGGQDWLADPTDVANLIPKIKDVTFYHKNISYYDHLDFIWGLDAATQVYSEIVTQIRNML